MGIFDSLGNLSPEQTQGLLAAAAQTLQQSGPSRTPTSFGQILGGSISGYQQGADAYRKRKQEEEQAAQLRDLRGLQIQSQTGELQQQGTTQAQQAAIDAAAKSSVVEGKFDPDAFLQKVNAISPLKALEYQKMLAKAGPEFDTKPQTAIGEDGKPFQYIIAKNGQVQRLDGILPRDELKLANLGGKDVAYNPFALQPGQSFQRTQTPDSIASNAVQIRGQNIGRQNALDSLLAPTYNQDAGGFITRPTAAAPGGTLTPLAGLPSRGPKLTEDQGKATGWLVQAENAFANMKAATTANPNAAKPGINDIVGAIPGLSGSANVLRGEDRQKFLQGASSLSESLLRAATGAGVNKDEALQKQRELTPQIGDSDAVIKQKMDSIPLYIESLKVRAGAGAPLAADVLDTANQAKSKIVKLDDGGSAMATRGADGNYYVKRGGKTYRVEE